MSFAGKQEQLEVIGIEPEKKNLIFSLLLGCTHTHTYIDVLVVSIAEISAMTKSNSGRKEFISP